LLNRSTRTLPDLPYWAWIVIPMLIWLLAWAAQIHLPIFDYVPGVAIIFLPAGARTLAVLVFGWRGAVGIAIGTLITSLWFFDIARDNITLVSAIMMAMTSGFSALLMFKLVQWWQNIPDDLSTLRLKHILTIVISQGLLSSSLHQLIYQNIISFYTGQPLPVLLNSWLAMAVGDALGSMLLLYTVAITARWLIQRVAYSEPSS